MRNEVRGKTPIVALLAVIATGCTFPSGQAQSLTWLGTLESGATSSAWGVSADGTVVTGIGDFGGINRAFRWTASEGMNQIGTLGGVESYGWGISADGRVIVGQSRHTSGQLRAFRWTASGGMQQIAQGLHDLGATASQANAASADGSVIVGYASMAGGNVAFRWANPFTLRLDTGTEGRGVSADGQYMVGYTTVSGRRRAMRWHDNFGIQTLGTLGTDFSTAFGVSADGNTVVGIFADTGSPPSAFRWTPTSGMQDLGHLGAPNYRNSLARAVSANGNIVVGYSYSNVGEYRAFRWTVSGGLENLNQTYSAQLTGGSYLITATALSPDGRYIVGLGYYATRNRAEAYLLDTWRNGDTNGDGCIDDADLLNVLFAFGTAGTGLTRHEDINKDGIVDDADLLLVLFGFGTGC